MLMWIAPSSLYPSNRNLIHSDPCRGMVEEIMDDEGKVRNPDLNDVVHWPFTAWQRRSGFAGTWWRR